MRGVGWRSIALFEQILWVFRLQPTLPRRARQWLFGSCKLHEEIVLGE